MSSVTEMVRAALPHSVNVAELPFTQAVASPSSFVQFTQAVASPSSFVQFRSERFQADDAAPVQTSVSAGSAPANSKPHTTAANWIFGQNRMG